MNCKYCGKKLKLHKGSGRQPLYCNENCKNSWNYHNNEEYRKRNLKNSKKQYYLHKDNPEFKAMHRKNLDKFIERHREEWNKRMNEIAKISNKKRYNRLKKLGICVYCGKRPARENKISCKRCR